MKKLFLFFIAIIIISLSVGCKKNKLLTSGDAHLAFSADTLSFDTLFTTIGSTTQYFKVYNPYSQKVNISNIHLQNGAASVFFINVDGDAGESFSNIELAAHDSMYVFIACKPNQSLANQPMVIYENVLFSLNGNQQQVTIEAWGQDAYFHVGEEIQTTHWKNDKPHVLLGTCLVDTGKTLTIDAGTKIFCHPYSYLLVSGKITAIGTKQDSIIFQGDRLEHYYKDLPGQWGGIVFLRSCLSGSVFEHVVLKNATSAIVLGSTTSTTSSDYNNTNMPDVTLRKCKIYNCDENGIFSFFSTINAENCLIYNCNKECVSLLFGGSSSFKQCTIANYGGNNIEHNDPVLRVSNYAVFSNVASFREVAATFNNCILIGNVQNKGTTLNNNFEIFIDQDLGVPSNIPYNYTFDHCVVQIEPTRIDANRLISCVQNPDLEAMFQNHANDDYHLKAASVAIGAGNASVHVVGNSDLDDKAIPSPPDIGCYQF